MNKQKIKEIIPDRLLYIYYILKLFPRYIWTVCTDREKIPNIHFYSDDETVDLIIHQRMSVSRFGDGEFMWMAGESRNSYQSFSSKLQNDLITAFTTKRPDVLIGIPVGMFHSSGCNIYAKMWWRIIRKDFFPKVRQYVDFSYTYCNASISRPYIDYHSRKESEHRFKRLQTIWDNREIIIVEGSKTKLGVGNDLLSNARSIKRIICPAENAYEKKEAIIKEIVRLVKKDKLILLALGPTASIIAVELAALGYQAVDIGHIDVEYMWFLNKEILRKPIEGKYVNESGIRIVNDKYDSDTEYVESIIAEIT